MRNCSCCSARLHVRSGFSARAAGLPLNIYYAGPDGAFTPRLDWNKDVRFYHGYCPGGCFVLNGQIPAAGRGGHPHRVQGGAGPAADSSAPT